VRTTLFILVLAAWLTPRSAAAHAIGLSTGEYRRTAEGLAVELVLSKDELSSIAERDVIRDVRIAAGTSECEGDFVDATPTDRDGVRLRARFRCGDAGSRLLVRLDLLKNLSYGHRHAAHVISGASISDELCFKERREFEVPAYAPAAGAGVASSTALGFVRMGFEHILSGYDHLLFLFALVVVRPRLRSLLWVLTAFTAAHSLTLALGVLGVVSPSPRIVEPAIALSIAYVGVENLVRCDFDKRWRITFPFGLVHGFGFAGALADANLPRADVPLALVMFNVGVELGQLALLALLWPIVGRLGRWETFRHRLVPAFSCCVVIAGAAWFVERVATRGGPQAAPSQTISAPRRLAEESSTTAGT
jgi:hydrogenase/urease accessory protein HupE